MNITLNLREHDIVPEMERRNSCSAALNEILAIDLRHGIVWEIDGITTENGITTLTVIDAISHLEEEELETLLLEKYKHYRDLRGIEQ